MFELDFEYPEYVSIGSKPDLLIVEVVNPAFFSSTDSGSNIPEGYQMEYTLPKQLKS